MAKHVTAYGFVDIDRTVFVLQITYYKNFAFLYEYINFMLRNIQF